MTRQIIFVLTLFCLSHTLAAQNSLGGWLMYFGDTKLKNENFKLNYELQHRNYTIYSDLNQLLLRGNIQYTGIENFNLAIGYANVLSEKVNKPDLPFRENRIFQEVMTRQYFGKLTLRHRFRFEQRFIDNQDFKTRARYQIKLNIPLFEGRKGNSLYVTGYNEIFINTNKTKNTENIFDRNRISGGIGYRFNKTFAVQTAYMTQILENSNDPQITVGIYHTL